MKITFERKELMKFGMICSLLSILLFFVSTSFADVTHGNISLAVTQYGCGGGSGTCSAWANSTYGDFFFANGDVVHILVNFSCNGFSVCNRSMQTYANISGINGTNTPVPGMFIKNDTVNEYSKWAIFDFNGTVNFTGVSGTISITPANVTINATNGNYSAAAGGDKGNITFNQSSPVWATVLLVNQSTPPSCPPSDANVQLPSQLPLINGTTVSIGACWSGNCTVDDRAQQLNSTHYAICGPAFGGSTTDFTQVASIGNFSNFSFVIEIPDRVKLNFTQNVSMGTQAQAQAIFQFAMKNIMSGARIGINDTEWGGSDTTKPNLNLSAAITFYNVSNRFGFSGRPQILRFANGQYSGGTSCPLSICSGFTWAGGNLTFSVGGFSDYGLNDAINVTLASPGNSATLTIPNATMARVNFTFIPVWSGVTLANCTLWGNFSSGPNAWSRNESNTTALVNGAVNGISIMVNQSRFVWNINCTDTTGIQFDYGANNFTTFVTLVSPIINNTRPTNNTYIKGTSTQLFQAYFYDYSMNTSNVNVTYANLSSAWTNASLTCYSLSTYAGINDSYICNRTVDLSSFPEGNNISYYFTADDARYNVGFNGTPAGNHTVIIDRTAPKYTAYSITVGNGSSITNDTTIRRWSTFTMKFNWTDNMQLSYWANITNIAGSRSDTNTTFSGNWTNVTYNPYEVLADSTFYVKLAANDSAGNENVTIYQWTINNVCGDGYCDIGETSSNCAADCGSSTTTTTTSGGGGTVITTTNKVITIIQSASPSEPAIATIEASKAKDLKIDEVKVELKDTVTNAQISVKESSLPSGANVAISTEQGATYKYLDISTTIPSPSIDKVIISFKVEKSWLEKNGIGSSGVSLQRYSNNQWNKLTTTKTSEDATYIYFDAESPGLSVFAVIGEKASAETPTTPTTPEQKTCPTCAECTKWSECVDEQKTRTCYRCSADTNYKCQAYPDTVACEAKTATNLPLYIGIGIIAGLILLVVSISLLRKKPKHTNSHHNSS